MTMTSSSECHLFGWLKISSLTFELLLLLGANTHQVNDPLTPNDPVLSDSAPLAGMYMGPSQMQFPVQATPGYQAFAGMGAAMPATTVMGAMMAPGAGGAGTMMGPNQGMMVGMTMPNGFMGTAPPAGMMGMAPRMMGPQGGAMPAGMMPAQGMYAIQPGQQAQWNMGQVPE